MSVLRKVNWSRLGLCILSGCLVAGGISLVGSWVPVPILALILSLTFYVITGRVLRLD